MSYLELKNRELISRISQQISALQKRGLVPPAVAGRMLDAIRRGNINFIKPSSVKLMLRGDVFQLNAFICTRCGLTKLNYFPSEAKPPLCPNCNVEMVQAPIFVPYVQGTKYPLDASHDKALIGTHLGSRNLRRRVLCPLDRREPRGIKILDPQRPIRSMAWICPKNLQEKYSECPYRREYITSYGTRELVCCYDPDDRKHNYISRRCEKEGYLPISVGIREAILRRILSAVRRGIDIHFQPHLPVDGVAKPLVISVFHADSNSLKKVDAPLIYRRLGSYVDIYYAEKMEIFQGAIGVRVGLPESPTRTRVFIPYLEQEGGSTVFRIYYRKFETSGIIVKADVQRLINVGKENVREKAEELVHTLLHAIIKHIPLFTGIEAQKFFEAIDLSGRDKGVVIGAVYDNSEGTKGATKQILSGSELKRDLELLVLESVNCPLNCQYACRACLFLERCIWLNRGLNRHLLREGIK